MSVFKFLLVPFALLYNVITALRNRLYDMKYRPTTSFNIPVISVGNLAVGGTGKTPMVEYLIRLLGSSYQVATLSRGYGRKTRGFKIASDQDTAVSIGDEPFQIYKKFSPQITVTVGEDRAYAIPMLLQDKEEINTIILDDAYQHRSVTPGFSILLTEYNNPFYNDYLLPYGRLREARVGAKRADLIVVTKCPTPLSDDKQMEFERCIRKYSDKPVYFSKIRYGEPVSFGKTEAVLSRKVILVSAIANAHILEEHANKTFELVKHFSFRDHYSYAESDLISIESTLKKDLGEVSILTTEKDYVKLMQPALSQIVSRLPIFYLPIETEFIRNGKDFDTLVLSFMQSFKPD